MQNDQVLREISESLKQVANNTKKDKKEPNYLLNLTWVAIGIVIVYILWEVERMAM